MWIFSCLLVTLSDLEQLNQNVCFVQAQLSSDSLFNEHILTVFRICYYENSLIVPLRNSHYMEK